MSIKFECSQCQHLCNVPDCMVGATVRCPSCKENIQVPVINDSDSQNLLDQLIKPQTRTDPTASPTSLINKTAGKLSFQRSKVTQPTPQAPAQKHIVSSTQQHQQNLLSPVDNMEALLPVESVPPANIVKQPISMPKNISDMTQPNDTDVIFNDAPIANPTHVGSGIERTFKARKNTDEKPPFWTDFAGLFAYPFRQKGLINLAISAIFFCVVFFILRHAGFIGFGPILMLVGYMFGYFFRITNRTILDDPNPPEWPSIQEAFGNAYKIFILYFFPLLLPQIIYGLVCWKLQIVMDKKINILLLLFGAFYIPMATLALIVYGSVSAVLSPGFIVRSIMAVPGHYFAVVGLFYVLAFFSTLLQILLAPIPFSSIINSAVEIYFAMVTFRLLGLMYLSCRKRLGWFGT